MNKKWTREQLIVALDLYWRIPFNAASSKHPDIIKTAQILKRTSSSINMIIGNFGSMDPELKSRGINGLNHPSKLAREIWAEFDGKWDLLATTSYELISRQFNDSENDLTNEDVLDNVEGFETKTIVKGRINQQFFRSMIMGNYNNECCITGINIPELLIASHIIPWSEKAEIRLDPRNGLLLNALHDKAFDKGLITIDPSSYKVIVCSKILNMEESSDLDFIKRVHKQKIRLPYRYAPLKEYLQYHNDTIFLK